MGDHLALLVNRLITESTLQAAIETRNQSKDAVSVDESLAIDFSSHKVDLGDPSSPGKMVECRICHDEDLDSNLETPCFCCGSLMYAHRRCVQRWCDEKGDTVCEICHQQFKPGYRAPPPLLRYGRFPLNFRRNWHISRRGINDTRLMRADSSDDNLLHSDLEAPFSRSLIFRLTVAIIFIVLLILRHTLPIVLGGAEFIFPLFLLAALRIGGILLLVYVTMLAVTGLRRQRHLEGSLDESSLSDDETDQQVQHESQVIQIQS